MKTSVLFISKLIYELTLNKPGYWRLKLIFFSATLLSACSMVVVEDYGYRKVEESFGSGSFSVSLVGKLVESRRDGDLLRRRGSPYSLYITFLEKQGAEKVVINKMVLSSQNNGRLVIEEKKEVEFSSRPGFEGAKIARVIFADINIDSFEPINITLDFKIVSKNQVLKKKFNHKLLGSKKSFSYPSFIDLFLSA